MKTLNDDFGTFIVGSDQVFNPEFVNNDKQIYYLGFVNDLNKKVSYSASFGQKEFKASEKDIIEVGYLLSRFNQIGVREESGVDICKNTFRIKAFHVLDPVFLLNANEWKKIANIKTATFDNIYYIVNAELDKEAETCLKNFKSIRYNLNIEDWLGTLLNAKFIVTDSFHALCFCLIFNKQFVYVGKNNGRQERVRSLFKMFELPLTSFLLDEKLDEQTILSSTKIDYTNWNKKLKPWIDLSEQFLKDALNNENTKIYDPYYFLLKKMFTEINQREEKKLKLRYYKYKILSKITFGKKRKKYKQKYKSLKSKLKEA